MDGSPSKPTVQVSHKRGKNQLTQALKENSFFDFQTKRVVLKLLDSNGNPLDPGAYQAQFYAGQWQNLDQGTDGYEAELLPAAYSFGVRYNGGWNQQDKVDIAVNSNVVFQTGR
jgi:hypothetical protein